MTDDATAPQVTVNHGQGTQVGDRNVMNNNYLTMPPRDVPLDPEMLEVLRADAAAKQVRRMDFFDVVRLFTRASPGDVRDVLKVLLADGDEARERTEDILANLKPAVVSRLVEPLLAEYPWLQQEPELTAVADGLAGDHPAGLPLRTAADAVIVAGRVGWPEYQETGAYLCWPRQGFWERVTHLGFYADGEIKPVIASIRAWHGEILLTASEAAARRAGGEPELAEAIEYFLGPGAREEGERYDIILLSPPDEPDTVLLNAPVVNDMVARSGKTTAWTQRFRYASLARLASGVTRTSEI